MFRYERFRETHFLEFLNQGLLDEDINEVISLFESYSPKLQFKIIEYLKSKRLPQVSLRVLGKALKVSQKDARHILTEKGRVFRLVITSLENGEVSGKIIKALVIPETSKLVTNNPYIKRNLFTVKKFIGKPFAVFFEEAFTGKSFLLPLAVALYVRNIPENLLFTGKIDSKGNILEVDYIEEKLKIAKKEGFKLITPSQVGHIDTIKAFLDKEFWNLPFYITSESFEEMNIFLSEIPEEVVSKELSIFEGIELFYDIPKRDFCIITGQLQSQKDWERVCEEFYININKIKLKLPGKKRFHFGVRGPATLAFALGVVWGSQEPFVIYHYQAGGYHAIEVDNPRYLKERTADLNSIKWQFDKKGKDLAILIRLSHHELFADAKAYAERVLKDPSFLFVEHRESGNVPVEKFKKVVQEVASLIQDLRKEHTFESFHFFFSCPVAIAFMLGVAFGHYAGGCLYNYQKDEQIYMPAIDFSVLRSIREGKKEIKR